MLPDDDDDDDDDVSSLVCCEASKAITSTEVIGLCSPCRLGPGSQPGYQQTGILIMHKWPI